MAALAGGGDTCGARRGKIERGREGEADKRARRGIFILFSFFLGCDSDEGAQAR